MTEAEKKEILFKIKKIQESKDYNSVQVDWLPPAHSDEYYFVSYSHKDYKEVFRAIFELQNFGHIPIHIWYDSALRAGKDWEIEARAHIYDYKCKGVIFFVSENSVLSDSIHKEIEFVKNSGKPYLSINFPVTTIQSYVGEYLSAEELLKLLKQDISENDPKLKVLCETFNKKITYLRLTNDTDSEHENNIKYNVKHIIDDLIRQPLLDIHDGFVTRINDPNVISIQDGDFISESGEKSDNICNCAFANCKSLESVELPASIRYIDDFAFYGCDKLKSVYIPGSMLSIGDSAFRGCENLSNITILGCVYSLGKDVFSYCNIKEATVAASSL